MFAKESDPMRGGGRWPRRARLALVFLLIGALASRAAAAAASRDSTLPIVEPNDNRHTAGTIQDGTLTLALRAGDGQWRPEGAAGPALEIEAFGEIGKTLTVPAPLIRVVEGTELAVSVRNDLGAALTVHGLCSRDGTSCAPLTVPPGHTRDVRFRSGAPGTYHYWASTLGAPVPFRELAGAFVVDDASGPREPDRILVITEWTNLTAAQLGRIVAAAVPTEAFVALEPRLTFVINGLSWPSTERFTYELGERVRWRVVNVTSQAHPMHLHGFYFQVDSLGDGLRDSRLGETQRRLVVTQLLPSGGTMAMTWTPERAGNWLFHCHVMHHVSLNRRLGEGVNPPPESGAHHHHATAHDAAAGMAGMVIGVTVRGPAVRDVPHPTAASPRRLVLDIEPLPGTAGTEVAAVGFALTDGRTSREPHLAVSPGPPIVLRRNEPVEITVANHLDAATAIHWHGLELDSYYDGVHGFSGDGSRVTPMIAPGSRFVVRFTPPRAGTFIYHTHLHDYRQLSSGLYGALIVTREGETFDPGNDHVIVIGRRGLVSEKPSLLTEPESVVINGDRAPRMVWNASARHRIRLINITPDDIFSVTLQTAEGPVMWTPVAKDGAAVPAADSAPVLARQTIAVGETYEFEFQPAGRRQTAWLEIRTTSGKWQAQGLVIIK
jgi:FtsP/CotA-like multicopper oxidase with cupredoxin domain